MSSFSDHIVSAGASLLPLDFLKAGKNLPVLLPFYHVVSDVELPFRHNYNYPTIEQFEKDLDFLLANFRPIGLDELFEGNNLSGTFHLSFDDGLTQCYDIIAPILKKKSIPATFFINPLFVDNRELFHRYKASVIIKLMKEKNIEINLQKTYADIPSLDETAHDLGIDWNEFLEKEKPYMSLKQIQKLQDDGFTIGAHSMDHPEFWLLDEENQIEEIRESMSWLNQNIGPSIKAFAFPFTDVGVPDSVFKTCMKEGLFDLSFGTAGLKKENLKKHFQRLALENDRGIPASKIVKDEFLAYRLKQLFNRHIARRDM